MLASKPEKTTDGGNQGPHPTPGNQLTGACQGRKYRWGSAVPFVWVYILLVQVLCKPVLRFLSSCSSLLAATKVEVEVEVQGKTKIKIRNKDNYNTSAAEVRE